MVAFSPPHTAAPTHKYLWMISGVYEGSAGPCTNGHCYGKRRPLQSLSKALLRCGVLELCLRLAFNLNVIGEAPLIMKHIQLRLPPPWTRGCCVFHWLSLSLSLSFYPSSCIPQPPERKTSVMCSGATQRNKAPYWVQSVRVNVCLGHKPQETGKKGGGGKGRGD